MVDSYDDRTLRYMYDSLYHLREMQLLLIHSSFLGDA